MVQFLNITELKFMGLFNINFLQNIQLRMKIQILDFGN